MLGYLMPYTMQRRDFIKKSGIGFAGLLITPSLFSSSILPNNQREIGLQLFTLREQLIQNVELTLKRVAEIGFKQVETFYGYGEKMSAMGFWGLDAKALANVLQKYGLKSGSGHYNTMQYLTNGDLDILKQQIDVANTLSQKYYTIPAMAPNVRQNGTVDGYKKMAELFNKAGELCKNNGLTLAYHNHGFEFKPLANKQTGFDILLTETEQKLVKFELDIFWAVNAGIDPIQLFKNHPGRFPMWHIKDMDKADSNMFTEVGTGRIDYRSIFELRTLAGNNFIFVEQDLIKIDAFDSISKSFNYVKRNLMK
jgi:sugar phosphate isomerase/epimerase